MSKLSVGRRPGLIDDIGVLDTILINNSMIVFNLFKKFNPLNTVNLQYILKAMENPCICIFFEMHV